MSNSNINLLDDKRKKYFEPLENEKRVSKSIKTNKEDSDCTNRLNFQEFNRKLNFFRNLIISNEQRFTNKYKIN